MSDSEDHIPPPPVCGVKKHRRVTGATVLRRGECVLYRGKWHIVTDVGDDGVVHLSGAGSITRQQLESDDPG